MPAIQIKNIYKRGPDGVRRGWSKWVKSIDATKNNGFALLGNFLNDGEHILPIGAVIVQKNPEGGDRVRRDSWWSANCYVVTDIGLKPLAVGLNWRMEFTRFRNLIAKFLDEKVEAPDFSKEKLLAQFTDEELLAECQRRLALAEKL